MSIIGGVKKVVGVIGTVGTAIKTAKTTWDYGTLLLKLAFTDLDGDGKSELENAWDDLIKVEKKVMSVVKDRMAEATKVIGKIKDDLIDLSDDLNPIRDRLLKLKAHIESNAKKGEA